MKSVAIIGAGYTGLTAAYRLQEKGHHVTVLERGSDIGGLVAGCTINGLPIERAYHFIYRTDTKVQNLAKELGVHDAIHYYNSTSATYYDGKLYPFMTAIELLKFPHLSFLTKIRMGLSAIYLSKVKKWKPLSKITAVAWLRKTMGEQAVKVIWEPLLRGKFDRYWDKVVMSWLWARIKIRTDSQNSTGKEELGYITGGFRLLSDGLGNQIRKNGGSIRLGVSVESVRKNDAGVTLTIDGISETFDAVIFTTPTNVYARLIEDDSLVTNDHVKELSSINYLDAVVMLFSSKQKFTPYFWHNVNDSRIPFIAFLSPSALAGTDVFKGQNIYYIGAYVPRAHRYMNDDPKNIQNEWFTGLQDMFPAFNRSAVTETKLFRFTNAQHIVDMEYKHHIPSYKGIIPHTYLANFSQIYPVDRGVNYAIDEGDKIATLVDADLEQSS